MSSSSSSSRRQSRLPRRRKQSKSQKTVVPTPEGQGQGQGQGEASDNDSPVPPESSPSPSPSPSPKDDDIPIPTTSEPSPVPTPQPSAGEGGEEVGAVGAEDQKGKVGEDAGEEKQRKHKRKHRLRKLGTKRTRGTYIALAVIVGGTFAIMIVWFVWALQYAGCSAETQEPQEQQQQSQSETPTRGKSKSGKSGSQRNPPLLPFRKNPRSSHARDSSSPQIKILGSEMVSVGGQQGTTGLHWLGQGQGIESLDGSKRLYLSAIGELILEDLSQGTPQVAYNSNTGNQGGFKFVLSSSGLGYILRADGSRVYNGEEWQNYLAKKAALQEGEYLPAPSSVLTPWETPNCRASIYRDCWIDVPNRTPPCRPDGPLIPDGKCVQSYVSGPYFLQFTDTGLQMTSVSSWNIPVAAAGDSSNFVLYPELVNNRDFPVPMWFQPCPSQVFDDAGNRIPPPPYPARNLKSSSTTGDCSKCQGRVAT